MSRKMLVIDDDPQVLAACRRIFETEGFQVVTAPHPHEGLSLVLDTYFDVILCDWMMPGLDGMEVISRLDEVSAGSAVIMISGYPSVERATEALKRGAVDYVPKPFTPDEIITAVNEALTRKEAEQLKIISTFGKLAQAGRIPFGSIDHNILEDLLAAVRKQRDREAEPSFESLPEPERFGVIIQTVLDKYERTPANLIAILQAVHAYSGYLSPEAVALIASGLKMSEHDVFGTASFYAQFKFHRPGIHHIKVCAGTACFVGGGGVLLEAVRAFLGIAPGQTTADGIFSLERVACLGCCALAPVVTIDDEVHAHMNPAKLVRTLDRIQKTGAGR